MKRMKYIEIVNCEMQGETMFERNHKQIESVIVETI